MTNNTQNLMLRDVSYDIVKSLEARPMNLMKFGTSFMGNNNGSIIEVKVNAGTANRPSIYSPGQTPTNLSTQYEKRYTPVVAFDANEYVSKQQLSHSTPSSLYNILKSGSKKFSTEQDLYTVSSLVGNVNVVGINGVSTSTSLPSANYIADGGLTLDSEKVLEMIGVTADNNWDYQDSWVAFCDAKTLTRFQNDDKINGDYLGQKRIEELQNTKGITGIMGMVYANINFVTVPPIFLPAPTKGAPKDVTTILFFNSAGFQYIEYPFQIEEKKGNNVFDVEYQYGIEAGVIRTHENSVFVFEVLKEPV